MGCRKHRATRRHIQGECLCCAVQYKRQDHRERRRLSSQASIGDSLRVCLVHYINKGGLAGCSASTGIGWRLDSFPLGYAH